MAELLPGLSLAGRVVVDHFGAAAGRATLRCAAPKALTSWTGRRPVWAVGFFFEAAGDLQLARFKANPLNSGKVMDRGVWRYTRHPNYFGDAAQW